MRKIHRLSSGECFSELSYSLADGLLVIFQCDTTKPPLPRPAPPSVLSAIVYAGQRNYWGVEFPGEPVYVLKFSRSSSPYRCYVRIPLPQPSGPRSGAIASTWLSIISFGPSVGFRLKRGRVPIGKTYVPTRTTSPYFL